MASSSYATTPRPPPTRSAFISSAPPRRYPAPQQALPAGPSNPSATAPTRTIGALAHKHAHHLHSIPPREKSVRTLILDHMLWMHARVRLRQARAELGMRTRSSNVEVAAERTNADREIEEHDMLSEGEDVLMLKFGAKERQRDMRFPSEDDHLNTQNLSLARALRLRADGVEKVVTAMVDQPPEIQPPYVDEDTPRTPAAIYGHNEDHLPNGVRLRLVLSTLINDLFSRDVPTPLSSRSSHPHSPPSFAHPASSPLLSSTPARTAVSAMSLPPPSITQRRREKEKDPDIDTLPNGLPIALASLSLISSFGLDGKLSEASGTMLPSFSSFTRANNNPITDTLPPILGHTPPSTSGVQQNSTSAMTDFTGPALRPSKPIGRVLQLYKAGADPATANSPPSLRCPRHLHHSCVICAAVKLAPLPTASNPHGGSGPGGSASSVTSGSSPSLTRGALVLGANGQTKSRIISAAAAPATGVESWKTGGGVGAGLTKAGIRGTALRRRTVHNFGQQGGQGSNGYMGMVVRDSGLCAVGCKLVDLIPRFLRLSALIAIELGREAADKEREEEEEGMNDAGGADSERMDGGGDSVANDEEGVSSEPSKNPGSSSNPSLSPYRTRPHSSSNAAPLPAATSSNALKSRPSSAPSISLAYRPRREWYAILSGLLTRAILEGYLSRGWKGPQGMECLMSVGLGLGFASAASSTSSNQAGATQETDASSTQQQSVNMAVRWDMEEDEEFALLIPDDYPSLLEAAKVLFPSLRSPISAAASSSVAGGGPASSRKGEYKREGPEAEFEQEMCERLTDFLTVPATTPDLSTHFEDLTYKFPAEPVERAAIRFCEAVTRWRGKPELENYKKRTELTPPPEIPPMSINSLIETPSSNGGFSHQHQLSQPDVSMQNASGIQDPGQPRKPSIEKYFFPPPSPPSSSSSTSGAPTRGQKRRRNATGGRGGGATGDTVCRSDEDEDADADADAEEDDGDVEGDSGRYRSVRWASDNNVDSMAGGSNNGGAMGPPRNGFVENGGAQRSNYNGNANVVRFNNTSGGAW